VTILVLFILAAVWAAVLLPPWLQNRSESRPADSITSFRRQLSVLSRSNVGPHGMASMPVRPPRPMMGPAYAVARSRAAMSRLDARRRRRDVLFTLIAAAGLTLLLGVILGGPVLLLHLAVDVLLGAYVVLLARAQRLASERVMKVRYLPRAAGSSEPALLLRRSGS
jgi:hypothetical protein